MIAAMNAKQVTSIFDWVKPSPEPILQPIPIAVEPENPYKRLGIRGNGGEGLDEDSLIRRSDTNILFKSKNKF